LAGIKAFDLPPMTEDIEDDDEIIEFCQGVKRAYPNNVVEET